MDLAPDSSAWLPDQSVGFPWQQPDAEIACCWFPPLPQVCEPPLPLGIEPDPGFTDPAVFDLGESPAEPVGWAGDDPAAIDPLTGVGEGSSLEPPYPEVFLPDPPFITDAQQDDPATIDSGTDLNSEENQVEEPVWPTYSMIITTSFINCDLITCEMAPISDSISLDSGDSSGLDVASDSVLAPVDSTTSEFSLSGQGSLEIPEVISCELFPFPSGESSFPTELLPKPSLPDPEESLGATNDPTIELGSDLLNVSNDLTDQDDTDGLEFGSSDVGIDSSITDSSITDSSITDFSTGLIRFIKPYYRVYIDPVGEIFAPPVDVLFDGIGETPDGDSLSYSLTGEEAASFGDPSDWTDWQSPDHPVLEPIYAVCNFSLPPSEIVQAVDSEGLGRPPLPWARNLVPSTAAPDPRVLRGATADPYSSYLAFLQDNPQWLEDHGATGIQLQVMTPSSHLPQIELGTPGDARAFDAWYEQTQLPQAPIADLPVPEQPPLPGSNPPPGGPPTPGDFSTPVAIAPEQPAPLPNFPLTPPQTPVELVSTPEELTLILGNPTPVVIPSIPAGSAAAASPLDPPAVAGATAAPSPAGESDLLVERRRREDLPDGLTLLPVG